MMSAINAAPSNMLRFFKFSPNTQGTWSQICLISLGFYGDECAGVQVIMVMNALFSGYYGGECAVFRLLW